jgi:enoyl-CoA hydratase/carnithine racemase
MSDHVTTGLEEGVLTVTLNRADKKNAITEAMYAGLADAVSRASTDRAVRVLLLRADGADFCAGNDIGDFVAVATGHRAAGEMAVFRFLEGLTTLDTPVVAAVKGRAVGIGTTVLLHADLVYVAEDAKLSVPFVNLALAPEAASSVLLPARIGHARAFAMFALGETLDGRQAASMGLANAALPADQVDAAALQAARALARRPASSLKATKRLMRDGAALWTHMQIEGEAFAAQLRTAEAREAFAAFAERREPDFTKLG